MFPRNYTAPVRTECDVKKPEQINWRRQTLLGRSWHVGVTMFILESIVSPLLLFKEVAVPTDVVNFPPQTTMYMSAKACCPFIQDRSVRSLPTSQIAPDFAEQHAHRSSMGADFVQNRKQTSCSLSMALLPVDLPPEVHFLLAESLEHPTSSTPALADDLDFAIRETIRHGANASAIRHEIWNSFTAEFKKCEGKLAPYLNNCRTATSVQAASHLSPLAFDLGRFAVAWPDDSLVWLICHGGKIVGKMPKCLIYRERLVEQTLSTEELLASSGSWIDSIMHRAPPRHDEALILWTKILEEVESKFLSGPFTRDQMDAQFGVNRWRPMIRFLILQGLKYRMIDNAKDSGTNASMAADECIHTTTVNVSVSCLRRFRELTRVPLSGEWRPTAYIRDMKSAYRQIPVEEHRGFSTVAVWSPPDKGWRFFSLASLAFGLSAAVIQFNRVPAFLVAFLRRMLFIPTINFYDDFKFFDVLCSCGSAKTFFDKAIAFFGPAFDPAKDQSSSTMVTFLGGTVDMSDIANDMITLKPTREKEDAMSADIRVFLANMRMSRGEAASLRGRILSWASYIAGRLAFGCLGALDHQADTDHSDEKFPWELEQCLNMILAIIELRMYRTLPLITSRPTARVYTDASFCIVDDIPIVKLCGIICDKHNGVYRGFVTTVPPSALLCFIDRETQIIVAEALAVILMLSKPRCYDTVPRSCSSTTFRQCTPL